MIINLSPYESQRIIPDNFAGTQMGRDLLAQDYLLKQFTSSLIYPEDEAGKAFWAQVYARAAKEFGTTDIPLDTFNKVWIMPERAEIYQKDDTVFLVDSHLKVMLEQDFMAVEQNKSPFGSLGAEQADESNQARKIAEDVVREVLIPVIEKEVNEGANFAQVRQIYNSMILAAWFKKTLKESLLGQVYADKSKVAGVQVDDPQAREKIYQQYLEAYKVGVFNYIKEEADPLTQELLPRKYFAGGAKAITLEDMAMADQVKAGNVLSVQFDNGQLEAAETAFHSAKGYKFDSGTVGGSASAVRGGSLEWWRDAYQRMNRMKDGYRSNIFPSVSQMADYFDNVHLRAEDFRKGARALKRVVSRMDVKGSVASAVVTNILDNPLWFPDPKLLNEALFVQSFDEQKQRKTAVRVVAHLKDLKAQWKQVKAVVGSLREEASDRFTDFDRDSLQAERLAADALDLYLQAKQASDSEKKQKLRTASEEAVLRYFEHPGSLKPWWGKWWGRLFSPLEIERSALLYRRYLSRRAELAQIKRMEYHTRNYFLKEFGKLQHPGFKAWGASYISVWPLMEQSAAQYRPNLDQLETLRNIVVKIPVLETLADQQVSLIEEELRRFESKTVSVVSQETAVDVDVPFDIQQVPEDDLMTSEDLRALLAGRGEEQSMSTRPLDVARIRKDARNLEYFYNFQRARVNKLRVQNARMRALIGSDEVVEGQDPIIAASAKNFRALKLALVEALGLNEALERETAKLQSLSEPVTVGSFADLGIAKQRVEQAHLVARLETLLGQPIEGTIEDVRVFVNQGILGAPNLGDSQRSSLIAALKDIVFLLSVLPRDRQDADPLEYSNALLKEAEGNLNRVWHDVLLARRYRAIQSNEPDPQKVIKERPAPESMLLDIKQGAGRLTIEQRTEARRQEGEGLTELTSAYWGYIQQVAAQRMDLEEKIRGLGARVEKQASRERLAELKEQEYARTAQWQKEFLVASDNQKDKELERWARRYRDANFTITNTEAQNRPQGRHLAGYKAQRTLAMHKIQARVKELSEVQADSSQDSVGGITMSDKYLTINIKVDGAGMPLPASMQDAAMVNIDGLSPVIHQIVPVTVQNIPVLADLMRSGV